MKPYLKALIYVAVALLCLFALASCNAATDDTTLNPHSPNSSR